MNMQIGQEAAVGLRKRKWEEYSLAIGTALLGMIFTISPNVFSAQLYVLMRHPGSGVWGFMFVVIGVARLTFLFVNGHYPLSPETRLWLSRISLLLVWFPLSFSFEASAVSHWFWGFGSVLPGTILGPMAMNQELIAMFTLSAICESRKING